MLVLRLAALRIDWGLVKLAAAEIASLTRLFRTTGGVCSTDHTDEELKQHRNTVTGCYQLY